MSLDIISVIIAFITLIVTISIPWQIMKFQRYTNLTAMYMNSEYGYAFQQVIEFFHDACGCDVERIPEEYIKRYNSDFEKLKNNKITSEDVLHFQRRQLSIYFYELECCRASDWRLRRMVKKDWTVSESYVLRILICMNQVVEEKIKKDISPVKHQHIPRVKGLNEYLVRLIKELKDAKPWMQM